MMRTILTASNVHVKIRKAATLLLLISLLLSLTPQATLPLWKSEAAGLFSHRGLPQEDEVKVGIEHEQGLRRITFSVPKAGTIYVNLPDDMAAGDALTGTVFAEAEGKGDERDKTLKALQQFTVEVNGKKIAAGEKTFKVVLPPPQQATALAVQLLGNKGKVVAGQELSVLPPPQPSNGISFTSYGQAGHFLAVACDCDGVIAEQDYLKVGGKEILTVAESPRQRVALNTSEATGLTQIEMGERGQVIKGEFRNIRLKMTASKLNLLRGEQARMRVEVSGLENLKEEIPLRLENRSTIILTLGGGDEQALTIRPADVQPGGIYTTERTLTGITVGAFRIEGIVKWNRVESSVVMIDPKITGGGIPRVMTALAPSFSAQGGTHDVGIIPRDSAGCPVGSEHININMDDEDKKNKSFVKGWTGDITHYSTGTTFGFCRVNGELFHSHPTADYAVLQLSSTCPIGSVSFFRVFDNQSWNNKNWAFGDIAPNNAAPPAKIYFCFFPSGVGPTMTSFPEFYVPYGVFAAPSSAWVSTGTVYTDDEDTDNNDSTCRSDSNSLADCSKTTSAYIDRFAKIIYGTDSTTGGRNSYLLVGKVTNGGKCINPCPYIGSYDLANCWVGQPPPGTTAFIWANNFYYTPVRGNQCPMPGSSFDKKNCYVRAIPSQTSPFIWANMWYVQPVCRP